MMFSGKGFDMNFVVRLLCVVGLVLAAGILGQPWIGFIAAGLAGYWISSSSHGRGPTASRLTGHSLPDGGVIAVFSLGKDDVEVVRLLRSTAGLTIRQAEELLMTPSEDLMENPARFGFADEADAKQSLQELTRLGAGANLLRS